MSVALVAAEPVTRELEVTGTIAAREDVPVGAEVGGLSVLDVQAEVGQVVRKGALLVRLNDRVLRAQARQLAATTAGAESALVEAQQALARAQELMRRGYLAPSALETASSRRDAAEAQLQADRAAEGELQARLDQTMVRAPVDGLIVQRNVTPGQIVPAGTVLFHLVRDQALELAAQVPEADLKHIRIGQRATITSDQVGQATGSIRLDVAQVDPQTRLGLVRIQLDRPNGFRPGMFGRARIQVLAVAPSAGLVFRGDQAGVFVIGPGQVVRFRPVTLVNDHAGRMALRGIAPGDRIVVEGAAFLSDGDRVAVSAGGPRA